jgi:hypothetical protein
MSKIFDRTLLHFTRELKRKFNAQSRKGRKSWNTMTEQELMNEIVKQVTERTVLDPVDLANYCAFIEARGYRHSRGLWWHNEQKDLSVRVGTKMARYMGDDDDVTQSIADLLSLRDDQFNKFFGEPKCL